MRILHVFKTYYPDTVGGIEHVISQLSWALQKRGHESRIFTLSPDPRPAVLHRPEGEVHRSQRTVDIASVPLSVRALWEFRRHARWADVIHYQYPWPFADVLYFLWGRGKPAVVSYQSDIVKQKWALKVYAPMRECFLRAVDSVVATSPGYIRSSDVLSRLPREIALIPNGIEESEYPQPSAEAIRKWRNRVGEDFFLFVGVPRYYKGLHTLVEAANGFPGKVVIAGDGPGVAALQEQIADAGLSNVELVGHVSEEDKMGLLHLCRAFVFPSHVRTEAFGMALVEASMASRPMVTCDISTGTTYVNEEGVTGHVVPPEDPERLRSAMQDLLDRADVAREMGEAARRRFDELFTADAMAGRYEALYREVAMARR
ncbi:MAG: glycosyltransferase [Burkholderiales bacterium]|nr:glycosyltransferase [Burkholderiales bacterium]